MKDWIRKQVIYQIYPKSFADSNNDGIGDIRGIIQKLDYLVGLGVTAICLSPVYDSSVAGNGYDISDYLSIYPEYGNMQDIEQLISEATAKKIKIIMDYIPAPGCHKVLAELRQNALGGYDCVAVDETTSVTPNLNEPDMVFSYMEADKFIAKWFFKKFNTSKLIKTIIKWQTEINWNANYLENHNQPRFISRLCPDKKYLKQAATMAATLLMTLRGTPYIFQGQEIAMTNYDFKDMSEFRDAESHISAKKFGVPKSIRFKMLKRKSHDNSRTPMQWDSNKYAGFSKSEPWINVNPNYTGINVKDELKDSSSVLNYYKNLIRLRKNEDILAYGGFRVLKATKKLFIYQREFKEKKYVVILNFSNKVVRIKEEYSGIIIISNYEDKVSEQKLMPYEAIIMGLR